MEVRGRPEMWLSKLFRYPSHLFGVVRGSSGAAAGSPTPTRRELFHGVSGPS